MFTSHFPIYAKEFTAHRLEAVSASDRSRERGALNDFDAIQECHDCATDAVWVLRPHQPTTARVDHFWEPSNVCCHDWDATRLRLHDDASKRLHLARDNQ